MGGKRTLGKMAERGEIEEDAGDQSCQGHQ
jgi:hypothetical protein